LIGFDSYTHDYYYIIISHFFFIITTFHITLFMAIITSLLFIILRYDIIITEDDIDYCHCFHIIAASCFNIGQSPHIDYTLAATMLIFITHYTLIRLLFSLWLADIHSLWLYCHRLAISLRQLLILLMSCSWLPVIFINIYFITIAITIDYIIITLAALLSHYIVIDVIYTYYIIIIILADIIRYWYYWLLLLLRHLLAITHFHNIIATLYYIHYFPLLISLVIAFNTHYYIIAISHYFIGHCHIHRWYCQAISCHNTASFDDALWYYFHWFFDCIDIAIGWAYYIFTLLHIHW